MKPRTSRFIDAAGLTLVEVVAALVLLSILGATVLPVLVTARRATVADSPRVSRDAIAKFADDWLASKEGSKLAAGPIDLDRALKSDASEQTVRIRSIGEGAEKAGHVWLAFDCAGTTVIRCAEVESNPTAESR